MKRLVIIILAGLICNVIYASDYTVTYTISNGDTSDASKLMTEFNNISTMSQTKVDTAGDTFTGAITFSGVTTDITTGTNEDLDLNPNGTGWVTIPKDTYGLKIGAGDDAEIYVSSDNLYIKNSTQDEDIIISINDGGSQKTLVTFDASEPKLSMSNGNIDLNDNDIIDVTNLYIDEIYDNDDGDIHFHDDIVCTGAVVQGTELGYDNVRIGTQADTPRILWEEDDKGYVWAIDVFNSDGDMRWIEENGGAEVYMTLDANGNLWIKGSYSNGSPKIDKFMEKKGKTKDDATPKDYLDWALEDAKKDNMPYQGLPRLKNETYMDEEGVEVVDTSESAFDTQEEVDAEFDKYGKDISKIAIGTARWAEDAEARIAELEKEVAKLKK